MKWMIESQELERLELQRKGSQKMESEKTLKQHPEVESNQSSIKNF